MPINPPCPNRHPSFKHRERTNNNQCAKRSLSSDRPAKGATGCDHTTHVPQAYAKDQETSEPAMERWCPRSQPGEELEWKEYSHSFTTWNYHYRI
jgi:hypothetical protein